MQIRKDLFFVHGGPGSNGQLERVQLAALLSENDLSCDFFDEPSNLRPDGPRFQHQKAYTHWLKALQERMSVAQPRLAVGMSFGGLALLHLIAKFPELAEGLDAVVMVAPTLDLAAAFRRMMDISERDFMAGTPEQVNMGKKLAKLKVQTRSLWDEPTREALGLVYQNPSLLAHYTKIPAMQKAWVDAISTPSYGMDPESQNAVISDLAQNPPSPRALSIKVHVIFGSEDPVFDQNRVSDVLRAYSVLNPSMECYDRSGHFPHLEQRERFVQSLKSLL